MTDMIPDLTHYAAGLGSATFPLKVSSQANDETNGLSILFTIVTLEHWTGEVTLDGQGFRVVSFSTPSSESPSVREASPLSERQQEALSGLVYETVEALLMALSPGFEEFFGQELSRKLGAISWDRFQHHSETEDSDNGEDILDDTQVVEHKS